MHNFTPTAALFGGVLIGLSASAMLLLQGKIAGISGVFAGILKPERGDTLWKFCFVAGLFCYPECRCACHLRRHREDENSRGWQSLSVEDQRLPKQQSTRPQTLSYGLSDSPAGQLTWVLEKFWSWTDCDGHPENVLTRDELLDNVMLYWLPGNAASSARLYWESFRSAPMDPVTIPVGCSIFPKEIFRTSKRWAEKRFAKLAYFNELTKGGHFAAFEQPETFVREVRACFRGLR